ncbi:MAG: endonuclease III [Clostridiales bacterium]|nr:endonuclease III [Clostridiales bacterium]
MKDFSTVEKIIERLKNEYPDKPALTYNTTYQLLVAVILSAQCTDERVNMVTKDLFVDYGTPEKMVTLTNQELEKKIFSIGLYKNKANNILKMSKTLLERFGGKVPDTFEELITLDGVGRKTANVVLSVGFNKPALAVDTHVFRVSRRIGLSDKNAPEKVEEELKNSIKKEDWSKSHHFLIYHGRRVCFARKPNCEFCVIKEFCDYGK